MKPSPAAWAVAARILPGGEWHRLARQILRGAGAVTEEEFDDCLQSAVLGVARGWRNFNPALSTEIRYARWLIKGAASKRRVSKGGIIGPTWAYQTQSPGMRRHWRSVQAQPLDAVIPGTDGLTSGESIPAPVAKPDEVAAGLVLRRVLTAVADRSAPSPRANIQTALASLDYLDRELAEQRGCARQGIGNARTRAIVYLREALTPAERFALSLARSPE